MSDRDVVATGLRAILESPGRACDVTTAGPGDGRPGSWSGPWPDVLLYDGLRIDGNDTGELRLWIEQTDATVVVVTPPGRSDLEARAAEVGVRWAVGVDIAAPQLVRVVSAAVSGQLKDLDAPQDYLRSLRSRTAGVLSARESQVVRLIVQGRTNVELAAAMNVSINSVKSYIRSAYRKMGVSTRSQAVAWAVQHGFHVRPADPDAVDGAPLISGDAERP